MSTGNIGAVPISPLGKLINVVTSILAYAFVALPTSILGAGFVEELDAKVAERKEAEDSAKQQELEHQQPVSTAATPVVGALSCPHCSKSISCQFVTTV